MKTIKVKMTLQEGMLGTSPANDEIYRDFIGSKAPDASTVEDEVEALGADAVIEKGMTIFPKTKDGTPFLYDYQIKGFFKDACSMLARAAGKDPETGRKKKGVYKSAGLTAYKKSIDGLVFPMPRKILIHLPEGKEIGSCQRPLRAQTAQGERVALAISEEVPRGSWFEYSVVVLDDDLVPLVQEWLSYAALRGIGQWRNSGKGRCRVEIIGIEDGLVTPEEE